MRFWIYSAVCLLVIGTLFPILRADGAGVAEGMIGGLGALALVLIVAVLVWLVKLPFKRSSGVAEKDRISKRTLPATKETELRDITTAEKISTGSQNNGQIVGIEGEAYKNAMTVIEYNEEASRCWERIKDAPENFQKKFLKLLNDEPGADVENLCSRIVGEFDKSIRPFDDNKANDLYQAAQKLGNEAACEFKHAYELLAEKANAEHIWSIVQEKFQVKDKPNPTLDKLEEALNGENIRGACDAMTKLGYKVEVVRYPDFFGETNTYNVTDYENRQNKKLTYLEFFTFAKSEVARLRSQAA